MAQSDLPAATFGERLDAVWGFIRRQYPIILSFLALAIPVGAIYHYTSPASYTASATLMIETRRGPLPDSVGGNPNPDAAWIESQIGVLKSLNVAAYVVKQLRLAEDPDFVRTEPGPIDRLLVRLKLKSPSNPSEADLTNRAVSEVSRSLDVRRIGLSYMMRVDVRSHNPVLASRIANTMVDAYIFEQLNAKYQANRRAGDWLQERLQTLREQAAAAERAVIEFKAKNNIVSAGGGTLMSDKQVAEINGQLVKARAQASDVQIRLERIESVRQAYAEDRPVGSADETVSEAMGNSIIGGLRSKYLDLVNREADWSVRYGKNHVAVTNIRNQIRDIRRSIRDELTRIEETFRSEYQIAKKRQDELEKALGGLISQSTATNQAQIALFSLESAAQSYRKIYESFLQRHTETVQQQSYPVVDARSLSPAAVAKTGPKALQIWMLTIFGGGLLGIGCGVLREALDRGFRTREQVRSVLQTDCLALVPKLAPRRRTKSIAAQHAVPMGVIKEADYVAQSSHESDLFGALDPRSIGSTPHLMQSVVDSPFSAYAEAIRSIKVSVDLNSTSHTKVIGLTSCLPHEGKTTLSSAMASAIGHSGARVLLVDCDLRNPTLSRMLTPDAKVGFLDVVAGRASLNEAIWTDANGNFSFLPTVPSSLYPNVAEMLNSEAARALFSSLQVRYDYVVVDLAPLVAALDVRATVQSIDSYVMVVEWGATKVDAVKYALRNVPGVQDKMVGVVLNKVDMTTMKNYDNYGAAYYYGQSRYPVH